MCVTKTETQKRSIVVLSQIFFFTIFSFLRHNDFAYNMKIVVIVFIRKLLECAIRLIVIRLYSKIALFYFNSDKIKDSTHL